MSRSCAWRRTVSDNVSWRQDQALNATIYILREIGPTGYVLKEEGEQKKFKVLIGDPHSCTCPVFTKEKDLCKHISWILLRKFRVPRTNPVTWQLGLVEREINELLRGLLVRQQQRTPRRQINKDVAIAMVENQETLDQREISEEDVCPICQDELLLKHEPVTFCKFGCGNSIHIKCMKVWAEHQQSTGDPVIKCPICRHDFGPIELLKRELQNSSTRDTRAERLNQHLGCSCQHCHVAPITGKCYKCSICAHYYLCQTCFNTQTHTQHSFLFRQKSSQRWRPAQRGTGSVLPQALVSNLMGRDITNEDYDMLLQLDNHENSGVLDIPEEVIKGFPLEKIRTGAHQLLQPGNQCRICLRGYHVPQFVRKLPCKHRFHVDCIDNWLMHQKPYCPIDGMVVWNPYAAELEDEPEQRQQRPQRTNQNKSKAPQSDDRQNGLQLEIPGVGIARLGQPHNGLTGTNIRSPIMRIQARAGQIQPVAGIALSLSGVRFGSTVNVSQIANTQTSTSSQSRLPPSGRIRGPPSQQVQRQAPSIPLPRNDNQLYAGREQSNSAPNSTRVRRGSGAGFESDVPTRGRRMTRASGLYSRSRSISGSRVRSSSRDRSNPQGQRSQQGTSSNGASGLYLGNDPRVAPPVAGDVVATTSSNQAIRRKSLYRAPAEGGATHQNGETQVTNHADLYLGNDPTTNAPPAGQVNAIDLHQRKLYRPPPAPPRNMSREPTTTNPGDIQLTGNGLNIDLTGLTVEDS
ncbi:E3 ubiquitin-protein ligase Zswim2-like isoform X2 [Lineus longissimus]|uniref:E3 ubiquitin-protein ligase Zswim2-like isoform X2 n=1 Tax=Lineus longissimus TaxID=88925 RepID=UPI002B4E99C3